MVFSYSEELDLKLINKSGSAIEVRFLKDNLPKAEAPRMSAKTED